VEANGLGSSPDCYRIKTRSSGYRLVYQVIDQEVAVFVVAIDRRERESGLSEGGRATLVIFICRAVLPA